MSDNTEFENRILSALNRLEIKLENVDARFVEFRDELKTEISRTSERISLLEAFQKSYEMNNQRFLDQILPDQQRVIRRQEDRIVQLEKDAVQTSRISNLESALDEVKKDASKSSMTLKIWGGIIALAVTCLAEMGFRFGLPR